ncbi:unnamed protein product [Arctogadus glacialis]
MNRGKKRNFTESELEGDTDHPQDKQGEGTDCSVGPGVSSPGVSSVGPGVSSVTADSGGELRRQSPRHGATGAGYRRRQTALHVDAEARLNTKTPRNAALYRLYSEGEWAPEAESHQSDLVEQKHGHHLMFPY